MRFTVPKGVYVRKSKPVGWAGPHPTRPLAERFWEKVDKSGECWTWTGSLRKGGYGQLQAGTFAKPQMQAAHRISYEMVNGPIP
jgi:hypothetical protein